VERLHRQPYLRGAQTKAQRQPEGNERLPDRDGAPSSDA
jgi:hypothetical protein